MAEQPGVHSAGVDVGGTFTDVVLAAADGSVSARKVPTTPQDQGEGVTKGLAAATAEPVGLVAHGTTTATNAVLERDVARTVLVTTDGFADLLVIGRQARPSLYDLAVIRPEPLVSRGDVVTVAERTAADGEAVLPLTDDEIERVCEAVAELAPAAVAVSLLFSYAGPAHEERLCAALEQRLEVPVTRSSALLPEFREYERASTCVLNAAVAPVMRRYLSRLADRLPTTSVTVMTSAGGTAGLDAMSAAPVHTLLSGPAAGVVAAAAVAESAGFADAVAFDMGGTSTDVCLIRGGRPQMATEGSIGGLPFRTPAIDIHTVGAGGGSLAWVDAGGALRVGPQSAGARPGPACYGHGGTEPTVTDAHCALGHLDPHGTLAGGSLTLDVDAATRALAGLPGGDAGGGDGDDGAAAEGVLTVVRATMARALRKVTTERGVDPRDLALVAYGGAGPLHATALAAELGCAAVIIPPAPGVLSALGLLLAPSRAEASRTVTALVSSGEPDATLAGVWEDLEASARAELKAQRAAGTVTVRHAADCRYLGQSHELRIDLDDAHGLPELFHAAHAEAYGYRMPSEEVELVTARVIAESPPVLDAPPSTWDLGGGSPVGGDRRVGFAGQRATTPVVDRRSLAPGDRVQGPAVVEQPDATTLLAPGDVAQVDAAGNLVVAL